MPVGFSFRCQLMFPPTQASSQALEESHGAGHRARPQAKTAGSAFQACWPTLVLCTRPGPTLTTLPALRHRVHTLSRRGSPFTSALTRCKLGSHRRFVCRAEWLTLYPTAAFFPHISHTRDMTFHLSVLLRRLPHSPQSILSGPPHCKHLLFCGFVRHSMGLDAARRVRPVRLMSHSSFERSAGSVGPLALA